MFLEISPQVTHVVSEFDTAEQVLKILGCKPDSWCAEVEILASKWLLACLREGKILPVDEEHKLKYTNVQSKPEDKVANFEVALYECQRVHLLKHQNETFTRALELLENFHQINGDDTRSLAYRRASCTLKCLPYTISQIRQLKGLPHLGSHSLHIVEEILEEGSSSEVERCSAEEIFQKMKLFCGVFGVGSKTAEQWVSYGIRSIQDALSSAQVKTDERTAVGLAFYEDLNLPVWLSEAQYVKQIVEAEAVKIVPGTTVEITGGFRRGKDMGHDIDLLISHPTEGKELGLLTRLLDRLKAMILYGNLEKSTFSADALKADTKLTYMRSSLDHFEKWIGVLKVDKIHRKLSPNVKVCKHSSVSVNRDCQPLLDQDVTVTRTDSSPLDPQETHNMARVEPDLQNTVLDANTSNDISRLDVTRPTLARYRSLSSETRQWRARRVDLVICPASQYFYALVGWTGSRMFNRSARLYAQRELSMKLTSHGLYDLKQNNSLPAKSEKEVFDKLSLAYLEPWERNC